LKERLPGSLEILLVRPTSRTGLAVGKFLGTSLSAGLPVASVSFGAIARIAAVTGKWKP
jgi:ABC-type Na+ efflux pump permease subunit